MRPFFEKHRYHLVAFIILIIIAGVSGVIANRPPEPSNRISTPEITVVPSSTLSESPTNTPTLAVLKKIPTAPNSLSPSPEEKPAPSIKAPGEKIPIPSISVTLAIPGATSTLSIPEQANAYDLLVTARNTGLLTFKEKNYGGSLGYLIEAINGIESSPSKKMFWIYYINGKKATIGISQYTLQPFDLIMWKYEPEE